jgi:hypothetical protein
MINKSVSSSEKSEKSLDSSLPEIIPPSQRKLMSNALAQYLKRNEANYPREDEDYDY